MKLTSFGLALFVAVNQCLAVNPDIHVGSDASMAQHNNGAEEPRHIMRREVIGRPSRPLDNEYVEEPYVEEVVVDDNDVAYFPASRQSHISHTGKPLHIVRRTHHVERPELNDDGELLQDLDTFSKLVPSESSGDHSRNNDVQLTLALKREDLPQLLEGVARGMQKAGGKASSHQHRAVPGDTLETDSMVNHSSAVAAGTTPKPDKKQEMPEPSEMPKEEGGDDWKGLPLVIGTITGGVCCCTTCGVLFWWFVFGGRRSAAASDSAPVGDSDATASTPLARPSTPAAETVVRNANYRDKARKQTTRAGGTGDAADDAP